jgi:YVTN family beta-propeller protein
MSLNSRHCLFAALLLFCLFVATGRSQYVEDSIDVGGARVGSLAYNSREDVLYGASESGVFFAISCDSDKVVESFPFQHAFAVTYDTTDNKAYCTSCSGESDSLLVVDGATHTRIKGLSMEGATTPVWDPISNRVYVSCQTMNRVAVVDCATDSLLTYIAVGACPIRMYLNTLRRRLYVLNYDAGSISIVDVATNQVVKMVVTGSAFAGYYCRSADKFYCDGPLEQCVVIGGQSDTIVARIALPGMGYVLSAAGNEDAGLVYLGTWTGSDDRVATVSTQNDSVLATVVIGREPWGITCYGPSGLVYCASAITNEVCVLAGDGALILTTIPVGDYPYVFALAPPHNSLYLGHLNTRYVYVLRDTSAGVAEPRPPLPALGGALSATPSPFNKNVAVSWGVSMKGAGVARVYAPNGRLMRQAQIPEGEACWLWDGLDSGGYPVPQGVYLVEVAGRRFKVVKAR